MAVAFFLAMGGGLRGAPEQAKSSTTSQAAPSVRGLRATPLVKDLRLRKDAPIPLEVEMSFAGPGLLEGRLEATLLHAGGRAGVHRTAEIVLPAGQRTVSLLLPPPPRVNDGDPVGVRLRWLGKDGACELGEARVGIYGLASNELILAIVQAGERRSEFDFALEKSLGIENFQPAGLPLGWGAYNTLRAPVAVESLPLQPLGWCSYDGVVFSAQALARTSEKQLEALTRWIEAGGSAFLRGDFALGFKDYHLAFLNHFTGPGVSFGIEEGKLVVPGAPGPICLTAGLGRVVVKLKPPTDEAGLKGKPWAKAVGWFWKVRPRDQAELEQVGWWSKWAVRGPDQRFEEQVDLTNWLWSTAIGYDALSPHKPRPLPLGLVAVLLGGLLLAVGPGDWFLLGWLRRRRWTWALLPLCCLVSAWWASQLAARTIGRADRTGSVVITDVGADGRVLRQCRFDMLLPARDREWAVSVRHGLAVPFPRPGDRTDEGRVRVPDLDESTGEWSSQTHFTSRRNLRQWTPVMTQSTSFPGGMDETGLPWDALAQQWAGLKSVQLARTTFSSQGWTVLFGHLPLPDREEVIDRRIDEPAANPQWEQARVDGVIPSEARMRYQIASALLSRDALRSPAELFSHRSPSIAGISVAFARPPAPLVALAWREGPHEIEIVRRLYLAKP